MKKLLLLALLATGLSFSAYADNGQQKAHYIKDQIPVTPIEFEYKYHIKIYKMDLTPINPSPGDLYLEDNHGNAYLPSTIVLYENTSCYTEENLGRTLFILKEMYVLSDPNPQSVKVEVTKLGRCLGDFIPWNP